MKQNHHRSKCAVEILCAAALGMLVAVPLIVATDAHAESPVAPGSHPVTVVTLHSEVRPAPGIDQKSAKPQHPPIQIVGRGVKNAGDSCWELKSAGDSSWELNDKGQITPLSGDCYILRSAAPGERPPSL
ncbi:hypothetical protein PWP93_36320 [Paraburkholderia sp. A1RI-2L]|uniref:hypothetical protein n=1 Tax=Paraburkholderia sp. A1RI-2L TaxID=3028367 RepID=UPI003B797BD0